MSELEQAEVTCPRTPSYILPVPLRGQDSFVSCQNHPFLIEIPSVPRPGFLDPPNTLLTWVISQQRQKKEKSAN